jgi:hypothetical protein
MVGIGTGMEVEAKIGTGKGMLRRIGEVEVEGGAGVGVEARGGAAGRGIGEVSLIACSIRQVSH